MQSSDMATFNPLAGLNPSDPFAGPFPIMTHFVATSSPDVEIDGRPTRKRQEEGETEFKVEYCGAGGYVYSVKYADGKIVLGVNGTGGDDEWGVSGTHAMSIKNWKLFRTVVCHDLDQTGFPDMLYVSQWMSPTGPEMYRVEADRYNRNSEEFIFVCVCEDRESVIANRGVENWRINPYPLNLEERFSWFKDLFFIQWSDWKALLHVFNQVDNAIKRDRVSCYYENVRRRLVFDDLTHAQKTSTPVALCRPKIIQNSYY